MTAILNIKFDFINISGHNFDSIHTNDIIFNHGIITIKSCDFGIRCR